MCDIVRSVAHVFIGAPTSSSPLSVRVGSGQGNQLGISAMFWTLLLECSYIFTKTLQIEATVPGSRSYSLKGKCFRRPRDPTSHILVNVRYFFPGLCMSYSRCRSLCDQRIDISSLCRRTNVVCMLSETCHARSGSFTAVVQTLPDRR